jgi:hypothetical protein
VERPTLASSCCTTRSALCFWAVTALLLYGAGVLLGAVWPTLRRFDNTLILVAMGGACFINYARNRTLHCILTGPVFLVSAFVTALSEAGVWHVNLTLLWSLVLVAVLFAFIVEWRTVGGQETNQAKGERT